METNMARAMILAAALALSACASAADEPAIVAPPAAASEPQAMSAPAPNAAASNVTTPAPSPTTGSNDEEVVVPGQVTRQLPTPADPRTTTQRMADIRAWDDCVLRLQGRAEDPTRPQLDPPEEICRRTLGMSERTAVPNSRR